jgi:hypothetical protein
MDTTPRGTTPVPDPTILTTQQLVAAIAAVREILETRLDAMDTATELNKQNTDKIPSLIEHRVRELEKLHDEKFEGVDKQFVERDARSKQVSELNQKALDAALQAAKDASGKTESSFTKQIADLTENFTTKNTALEDRLNDLKSRIDRGEGGTAQTDKTRGQANWMVGIMIIGGVAICGLIVDIIALFAK